MRWVVEKMPGWTLLSNRYTGSRYLVGLWETTLHIDLTLVARGNEKSKFLDRLRLPSWSWLAYEGSIAFTTDRRSLREPETVLGKPASAIKLIDFQVVGIKESLPAKQKSFLVLTATLRCSFTVSDAFAATPSKHERKEEYFGRSPFNHDPHTSTFPIQLTSLSRCREIYDAASSDTGDKPKQIGFISFDDDTSPPKSDELVLAHISTLLDGLGPCFRAGALAAISFGRRNGVPVQPILAYALVLRKTGENADEYQRLGVAEVNYDWITKGGESTIRLV